MTMSDGDEEHVEVDVEVNNSNTNCALLQAEVDALRAEVAQARADAAAAHARANDLEKTVEVLTTVVKGGGRAWNRALALS